MPGCPAGVTTTERAPDKGVSEDVGIPGLKPGQAGRPGLPVWTAVPLVSGTGITREPLGLTRPGPRQVAGEQTAGGGDTRPQSAGPHLLVAVCQESAVRQTLKSHHTAA